MWARFIPDGIKANISRTNAAAKAMYKQSGVEPPRRIPTPFEAQGEMQLLIQQLLDEFGKRDVDVGPYRAYFDRETNPRRRSGTLYRLVVDNLTPAGGRVMGTDVDDPSSVYSLLAQLRPENMLPSVLREIISFLRGPITRQAPDLAATQADDTADEAPAVAATAPISAATAPPLPAATAPPAPISASTAPPAAAPELNIVLQNLADTNERMTQVLNSLSQRIPPPGFGETQFGDTQFTMVPTRPEEQPSSPSNQVGQAQPETPDLNQVGQAEPSTPLGFGQVDPLQTPQTGTPPAAQDAMTIEELNDEPDRSTAAQPKAPLSMSQAIIEAATRRDLTMHDKSRLRNFLTSLPAMNLNETADMLVDYVPYYISSSEEKQEQFDSLSEEQKMVVIESMPKMPDTRTNLSEQEVQRLNEIANSNIPVLDKINAIYDVLTANDPFAQSVREAFGTMNAHDDTSTWELQLNQRLFQPQPVGGAEPLLSSSITRKIRNKRILELVKKDKLFAKFYREGKKASGKKYFGKKAMIDYFNEYAKGKDAGDKDVEHLLKLLAA